MIIRARARARITEEIQVSGGGSWSRRGNNEDDDDDDGVTGVRLAISGAGRADGAKRRARDLGVSFCERKKERVRKRKREGVRKKETKKEKRKKRERTDGARANALVSREMVNCQHILTGHGICV